jgi:hypothetical protein
MVTQPPTDEPADFAGFRARRAALKEERRRQKARDNFTAEAPDYGREIPPRLNPDVPESDLQRDPGGPELQRRLDERDGNHGVILTLRYDVRRGGAWTISDWGTAPASTRIISN